MIAKQIDLDLLRTMPNNKHFATISADGIDQLRRVLRAFSIHNPSIGYVFFPTVIRDYGPPRPPSPLGGVNPYIFHLPRVSAIRSHVSSIDILDEMTSLPPEMVIYEVCKKNAVYLGCIDSIMI